MQANELSAQHTGGITHLLRHIIREADGGSIDVALAEETCFLGPEGEGGVFPAGAAGPGELPPAPAAAMGSSLGGGGDSLLFFLAMMGVGTAVSRRDVVGNGRCAALCEVRATYLVLVGNSLGT
jgi:hypothetical protein